MAAEDSILNSVKKVCNIDVDCDDFDVDLLLHINSVLSILQQLGVGPEEGFYIDGPEATWEDYLGENSLYINMIKSYLPSKVRLLFDPPISSAVMNSLENICAEFEWRCNVAAENKKLEDEKALEG